MPEQQGQQLNEEQLKALQEKIKQMSPEELKEFQKKQCIFCQIVAGKVQSRKVFEDDVVIGILDINPANPGHILLMPKEHYSIMPQMPDGDISYIFMAAKAISNAMLRALEVQGTNLIVANGVAAGQRAQHFMIHIIPRKDKDNLKFVLPQKTINEEELEKVRESLIKTLGSKIEEKEQLPVPQIPKEKMVVEGEFEEKKESSVKEPMKEKQVKKESEKPKRKEKPKKDKKAEKKKQETKKEEPESKIDLDDIAKILGAK